MRYKKPKRISKQPTRKTTNKLEYQSNSPERELNNYQDYDSSGNYFNNSGSCEDGGYTFKARQVLTTSELREVKDFEECTFHPRINKNKSEKYLPMNSSSDNNFVYEKLYNDSKINSDKKYYKKVEHMRKESNDYTFKPKLISRGNSSNNLKLSNSMSKSYDFYDNMKKVIYNLT
jgi:hypothetical protein